MQVVSRFTYTLETIIQAGKLLVAVDHVPVRTNPKTRESRLFPSIAGLRPPQRAVDLPHLLPVRAAEGVLDRRDRDGRPSVALFIRFLIYFVADPHTAKGHIQSLIAGAVLFNAAMLLGALGVIGDLLDAQRTLSQRTFERVRRIELQLGVEPSHYEPGRALSDAPAANRDPAPGAADKAAGSGPGDREALGV